MLFSPRIDKDKLRSLPRASFAGSISIIDTKAKLRQALKELKGVKLLGLDTETKPIFEARKRRDVCLLQLATTEHAYLFRLNKIGLDQALIRLLSDKEIVKVGLSLQDDCRALKRLGAFIPASFIELQRLCPGYGIYDSSLQKIYAITCEKYLSKSQRMSNWEVEELSDAQQQYAALDAVACLEIYNKLMSLPCPKPISFALLYE